MRVVALVGGSGTGKSYRAITLAYEKGVDYIIDDGLLIQKNKIIAGKSAKREETTVGAVKRALFHHDAHCQAVKEAIENRVMKGILILGTSTRMVDKIAGRLGVGPIEEYVFIEDITSEAERKMAKRQRQELGKHVIPVPTFELKKDFSGYFLDPLKILRRRKDSTVDIAEKSVVRPTFSYMGKYVISDKVISDLSYYGASRVKGVSKVAKVEVMNEPHGIAIKIEVVVQYGSSIQVLAKRIQEEVKKEVEHMTSLNILKIEVYIKSLVIVE